ncbi:MAG: hypothetical protein V1847_00460 [Candidatus Diapherotrites archaeon]
MKRHFSPAEQKLNINNGIRGLLRQVQGDINHPTLTAKFVENHFKKRVNLYDPIVQESLISHKLGHVVLELGILKIKRQFPESVVQRNEIAKFYTQFIEANKDKLSIPSIQQIVDKYNLMDIIGK